MNQTITKSCACSGFNYCKWAKTLVAIPALPIIALIAASFFTQPLVQIFVGILAAMAAIKGAIWLDNIQFLQKKIRNVRSNPDV